MKINRRKVLQGFAGSVAFAAVNTPIFARASSDVIKVGVIQPQAGDCAQWGVPITRAIELWAEEINEKGGVAADGKTYAIEVTGYDNICYAAGDELKAAKRAMLDDGVRYLLQTYAPACRQAIAPLTNETKTLVTSYGAGFVSNEFPYLVGGQTGQPMGNTLTISNMIQQNPTLKRIAIITSDTAPAIATHKYILAGIQPHLGEVEIVYDQTFGASSTSDMLGLLTPLAETKPDIIYEHGFTPGQKASMINTMEQLGFTGLYGSESWEIAFISQAGLLDVAAGRLVSASSVDAQEPTFSPRAHEMYKKYIAKYGEAEWISYASSSYAAVALFELGWSLAGTADSQKVMEALYAQKELTHPVLGKAQWGGEELFGVNHHLLTAQPIYGVDKSGAPTLVGVVDTVAWWNANKDTVLPILKG